MAKSAAAGRNEPTVVVNVSLKAPFEEIASELASAGLEVHSSLDLLGIVTGEIAVKDLSQLSAVAGVSAVEPDRTVEAWPSSGSQQPGPRDQAAGRYDDPGLGSATTKAKAKARRAPGTREAG